MPKRKGWGGAVVMAPPNMVFVGRDVVAPVYRVGGGRGRRPPPCGHVAGLLREGMAWSWPPASHTPPVATTRCMPAAAQVSACSRCKNGGVQIVVVRVGRRVMASGHLLGPLQKGIGDRDAAGAGHLDHGSGVVLRHRPGTDYPDAKRHDDLLCDVFYR